MNSHPRFAWDKGYCIDYETAINLKLNLPKKYKSQSYFLILWLGINVTGLQLQERYKTAKKLQQKPNFTASHPIFIEIHIKEKTSKFRAILEMLTYFLRYRA